MPPEPILTPLALEFLTGMFFVFGSLLGSFSNVVILRMAEGRSVVFPPSSCPHCHHRLSPLDLIPIFGWVLLGGKCRYCQAPISRQYPLVELAAALTLSASFAASGFSPKLVPQAAWGIIWLIMSVLWFRGEVRFAAPFLFPLILRPALGLWAGHFEIGQIVFPFLFGGATALLIFLRRKSLHPVGWFGISIAGLFSTSFLGWIFPAVLGGITILYLIVPEPAEPESGISLRRLPFFLWNLAGMAICGWLGNWGF